MVHVCKRRKILKQKENSALWKTITEFLLEGKEGTAGG